MWLPNPVTATVGAAYRPQQFGGQTQTYYPSGDLLHDGNRLYVWNARGQLNLVTGGSPSGGMFGSTVKKVRSCATVVNCSACMSITMGVMIDPNSNLQAHTSLGIRASFRIIRRWKRL